jgi:hypothetical protein
VTARQVEQAQRAAHDAVTELREAAGLVGELLKDDRGTMAEFDAAIARRGAAYLAAHKAIDAPAALIPSGGAS